MKKNMYQGTGRHVEEKKSRVLDLGISDPCFVMFSLPKRDVIHFLLYGFFSPTSFFWFDSEAVSS